METNQKMAVVRRGWKQWGETEARQWVGRCRASGLRVADFCEREGCSRARLNRWASRLGEPLGDVLPVRMVEARVVGSLRRPGPMLQCVAIGRRLVGPIRVVEGRCAVELGEGAPVSDLALVWDVVRRAAACG